MDDDWIVVHDLPQWAAHKQVWKPTYTLALSSLATSIEILHLCLGGQSHSRGLKLVACRMARAGNLPV